MFMLRNVLRTNLAIAVMVSLCGLAFGQYGGGGGGGGGMTGSPAYTPRGSYSSKGPAIAGAAAGAAALGGFFYWRHHRAKLEGCVSGDGDKLLNDSDNTTYSLTNKQSETLKPGERLELRGKKLKNDTGEPAFEVHKVGKDYGSCTGTAAQNRGGSIQEQ